MTLLSHALMGVTTVSEYCNRSKVNDLQIPELEDQLLVSLLPKDEADERDIVLEALYDLSLLAAFSV